MTVTEEFQIFLKTGKYQEALLLLITQSLQLTVTTKIGPGENLKISSQINLIEGKIENRLTPTLLRDKRLNQIKEIHSNRVQTAHQLIASQLGEWQELLGNLASVGSVTPSEAQITAVYTPDIVNASVESEEKTTEWAEFMEEVEPVEVIPPSEETEDWGDWMEDEEKEEDENEDDSPNEFI